MEMKKPRKGKRFSAGQLVLLIAAVLLGLAALTLCGLLFSGCSPQDDAREAQTPKYVFMFVGDGMGVNQVAAARYLQEAQDEAQGDTIWRDSFDSFPSIGLMSTHSLEQPTDSAAAITAMLTGQKVHNQEINYSSEASENLTPFAVLLKEKGYSVGVVTSTSVDHATPAGLYASNKDRNSYSEIALQGIAPDFLDFLGGGGFRADIRDSILTDALANGFEVYSGADEIRDIKGGDAPVIAVSNSQISKHSMAYEIDRLRSAEYGGSELALSELLQAAVRRLETRDMFFILCEGAMIDIACAEGDLTGALYEVTALDDAVKTAMEFYNRHPEETLIITLSDHETGGLRIGSGADISALKSQIASARRFRSIMEELYKDGGSFEQAMEKAQHYFGISLSDLDDDEVNVLEESFAQSLKGYADGSDEFTDELCSIMQDRANIYLETTGHTGQPVPVYSMGVGAEEFAGVYDNTDIYYKLRKVLGIEA